MKSITIKQPWASLISSERILKVISITINVYLLIFFNSRKTLLSFRKLKSYICSEYTT